MKFTVFSAVILAVLYVVNTQDGPPLYIEPLEIEGKIGESFTFECHAKVSTGAAPTLTWAYKGTPIDSNKPNEYEVISTSDQEERSTMSRLTIINAMKEDEGDYICSAEEFAQDFKGTLRVYQHYDVVINGNPVLTVGEDLEFMCAVDEKFLLPVTWYLKDQFISNNDKFELKANNTLIIKNVQETDAGVYVCTYTSDEKQFSANITVGDALELKGPTSIKYTEGERARFECKSSSKPPPTITWTMENGTFDERFEQPKISHKNGDLISTLILKDVKMEDRGNYICTADNGIDIETHTIMLRVRDRLAALWPFIGIMSEVIILIAIIFIHEKCTQGNDVGEDDEDDEAMEPIKGGDAEKQPNSDGEGDIRMRASKE